LIGRRGKGKKVGVRHSTAEDFVGKHHRHLKKKEHPKEKIIG